MGKGFGIRTSTWGEEFSTGIKPARELVGVKDELVKLLKKRGALHRKFTHETHELIKALQSLPADVENVKKVHEALYPLAQTRGKEADKARAELKELEKRVKKVKKGYEIKQQETGKALGEVLQSIARQRMYAEHVLGIGVTMLGSTAREYGRMLHHMSAVKKKAPIFSDATLDAVDKHLDEVVRAIRTWQTNLNTVRITVKHAKEKRS
jgi:hypothetical protein